LRVALREPAPRAVTERGRAPVLHAVDDVV
jgi:hypothetical protein